MLGFVEGRRANLKVCLVLQEFGDRAVDALGIDFADDWVFLFVTKLVPNSDSNRRGWRSFFFRSAVLFVGSCFRWSLERLSLLDFVGLDGDVSQIFEVFGISSQNQGRARSDSFGVAFQCSEECVKFGVGSKGLAIDAGSFGIGLTADDFGLAIGLGLDLRQ